MIVAVSQIILVDMYYALNGQRAVIAAAASAALLLVSWAAVGTVYGKLLDGGPGDAEA